MRKPSSTEILLTVSAAGALVSGFLGHIAPIGITKASLLDFIDAFLGSVRYLVLDGFDPPEQAKSVVPAWSPWAIRVSRLFGVVFAAVGAWAILWRLFGLKDLLGFWWRVRSGRDLDLIIGVDAHGQRILADDKMNGQTIAIDLAPTAQARESCRRRRIPLLALDASTEQVVHRLSDLGNVKRVFVATNSDEVCAAIVHRLARHVRGHTDAMGGSRRVQFILRARSEKVLSVLLADLLGNHDIRIYTDEDSTARLLYQRLTDPKAAKSDIERRRFTRFGTAGAKVRHARLVLFGAGKLADAILLQHLHNDIFEREITVGMDVVCDDGPAAARRFVELHPCFRLQEPDAQAQANAGEVVTVAIPEAPWEAEGVLPRVHFHTLPPSGRGQREWVERHLSPSKLKGTDTNLIIVFDDPSEVIQLVLSIAPLLITTDDTCQPKFWAYVNSRKLDRTNAALQQEELLREFLGPSACKQVTVFTDYEDGRCAREELANDEIEQAAMKVHDVYASMTRVRLVLFGCGELADAILRQHMHKDFFERVITVGMDVVCADGQAAAQRFVDLNPRFHLREPTAQGQSNVAEVVAVTPHKPNDQQRGVLPCVRFHTQPITEGGQREWLEAHLPPSQLEDTDTNVVIVFDDPSDDMQLVLSNAPLMVAVDDTCQPKFWAYVNRRKLDRNKAMLRLKDLLPQSLYKQVTVVSEYEEGQRAPEEFANDEIEPAMMLRDVYASVSGNRVREKIEEAWWNLGRQWHKQWERTSSRHCGAHAWVKLGILQRLDASLGTGAEEKQTSLKEFLDLDADAVMRLAEVEHRRWCASHLLAGWRPLLTEDNLRLQSSDAGFKVQEQIRDWFHEKKIRDREKRRRRHLSLLPFESLKDLNTFEPDRGNKEIKKDHNIARATIAIIRCVEEVRSQRVEQKARAASGAEGSSGKEGPDCTASND